MSATNCHFKQILDTYNHNNKIEKKKTRIIYATNLPYLINLLNLKQKQFFVFIFLTF